MIDVTDIRWVKSSYSDGGATCVEVARVPAWVAVRDSKVPAGPVLMVSVAACGAFLGGLAD
jgi:hypothetical protein